MSEIEPHARECKLIEVIKVVHLIGEGKSENPYRLITEFFDKEGTFLASRDPYKEEQHDPAKE